jgi:hypothetical protein
MTPEDIQYDRTVYLEFLDIHEKAHRHKVKFVQERSQDISLLRDKDRQYIELDFMLSLFEIGDYERYIEHADSMIEMVIDKNIFLFKDYNIFTELLQKKALSLFHTYKDEESLALAKQLKTLNKESDIPDYIIKQILKRKKRKWFISVNGFVIFLILATAAILFFEIILFRPIYTEYVGIVETIRNTTMSMSFLILFLNHVALHFVVRKEAKRI